MLYLLSFKRFLKGLTHFMFFKERNNSLLIANRMTTMGIMPARELTPKDFLALIAFLMNFRLPWKTRVNLLEYRFIADPPATRWVLIRNDSYKEQPYWAMTTDLVAWSAHPKATEAERYAEGRMNCTYAKHKLIIISHLHPKYLFYLPRTPNYKNQNCY